MVKKRILSVIAVLGRLKYTLPFSAKLKIYNSLINCHLSYGNIIWGKNKATLEKLQKRALRLVHCFRYNSAHTDFLFKNTNTLKFSDMFNISLVKFFNNYKNRNLPPFMLNLCLSTNADFSKYPNTRHANDLHKRHCHGSSLCCLIPILFNDSLFPQFIKEKIMDSNKKYGSSYIVKQYKSFLINNYSGVINCLKKSCYPCSSINENK